MKTGKVVIAGGTGLIGKYIGNRFREEGYEVIVISRQKKYIGWDDVNALASAVNHSTLLINLAGKSVNCRYNQRNREEIMRSRIDTTAKLGDALLLCNTPPPLWINAGTATIYRHAEDKPMTEVKGEIGAGFSVNVAKSWENKFFDFKLPGTRQVALRMAIVLGRNEGVMKPLMNLVSHGLGGKQGRGNQMFSWIHIEDLFDIISFISKEKSLSGVINCSSPYPVSNKILMKELRNVMHKKIGLPAPEWMLRIGAIIINTETELILKSRWVIPERLIASGYVFKYPTIDAALKNLTLKN